MNRSFRRPRWRAWIFWALVVLILAIRFWPAGPATPDASEPNLPALASPVLLAEGLHAVERVVDGDTLEVSPHARVRLLGVDTPETVKPDFPVEPWGPEATQFTRQFVASGAVRLQFDRERVDRYGRFLAYVWVEDRLLNEELVRAGLARYEPQYHYSAAMKRRFRRAQQEARSAQRGVWSEPGK